ncbi:MAG: response regulator [Planctomycetes bacterium]|nr:response regulator [Planctomycetota bacterium]
MNRTPEIMYVDDNLADLALVQCALEEVGTEVHYHPMADSAAVCDCLLTMAEGCGVPPPDLILLDLNMPRVSGLDVLDCIRHHERTHDLSVVMMTTSNRSEDRQACRLHGADDYVVKPTSYQDLVDMLRKLVERMGTFDRVVQP